jgi:Na+-driven multidrug efflux pump
MVLFGVVRATGAVMPPLIILTVSLLLIRYPLAEVLLDRWHADAIWWSFPISSVISLGMALLYYKFGGWRQAHMIARPLKGNAS